MGKLIHLVDNVMHINVSFFPRSVMWSIHIRLVGLTAQRRYRA
jgi:hypothetical protein